MHKHPRREKGLTSVMAILGPIALLLMVALVPIHVGSGASTAGVGPLLVSGTVNSSAGSPVNGAAVVVTVLDGVTVRIFMPTTSDINGFYAVSVDPNKWDVGNTIEVVATYNSVVGQNSSVITDPDAFGMTIDVKIGTVIPELGGPVTIALAVSAIGAMVVFYSRRRGSESP